MASTVTDENTFFSSTIISRISERQLQRIAPAAPARIQSRESGYPDGSLEPESEQRGKKV